MDDAQQDVQEQQADLDLKDDPGHVQHDAAADAHAAAPGKARPGAEVLEGLHQGLVLLPLDEAVVGDAVDAEVQALLPAVGLHPLQEPEHVGGDPVHVQRQGEHHRLGVVQLL